MDADRVEHFLRQQFRQLDGALHPIHEDDDLVDGQLVQQVAQLLELFALSCNTKVPPG